MPPRDDLTGGWCWFQGPRVLAAGGATYVGWTEYDERGTVSVARFDHERRAFALHRGVGATPALAPDDHNAPALFVRADGRLVVFYTAHNRPDDTRYRVAERPDSVASFGPERAIPDASESTYPMPVRLPATGEVWYLYRDRPAEDVPGTFYCYRSPDDGETWSARRRLYDVAGDDYSGYVRVDAGGDRVDVCFSRHPRSAPLAKCDVRHCYYDAGADQFRDSHGTPLSLPLREADMTQVFDAATTGERAWIWDVQTAGDRPAIAFAAFADGDERDQRYYHARYSGGEWAVTEVAETDHLHATYESGAATEREYAPGICLGHLQGADVLYLSRNSAPRDDRSRGLDLERWRVDPERQIARRERVLARGDASNQFRPAVPRAPGVAGGDSPVRAVWMRGQARAPYDYHDPGETVHLAAAIETRDEAGESPTGDGDTDESPTGNGDTGEIRTGDGTSDAPETVVVPMSEWTTYGDR